MSPRYTQLYVLATASPKPVMVRCKSATPEWQRHKGTQEQPPGLGWAAVSAISAGMALYWVTLYWVTPPPLSPPADMQAVFDGVWRCCTTLGESEIQAMLYNTQKILSDMDHL